jgi:hypothetical protein
MSTGGLIVERGRGEQTGLRWAAVGLGCLVAVALALGLPRAGSGPAALAAAAPEHSGWSAVPLVAQLAISRAIGADQPSYQVHGTVARDRAQELSFRFSAAGVTVSARGGTARLGLRGPVATPSVHGNRVAYDRGGVSEWYANGPLGLEQGFTLSRAGTGTLALVSGGSLRARVADGGAGLVLVNARGHAVLRERGLSAWDARGRAVGVRFVRTTGGGLAITVRSAGAAFPVTVDPVVQQAQLTASDGYANEGKGATVNGNGISAGGLGASVAIAGQTIAVGAPGASVTYSGVTNSYQGAVYVFTEPASGWANATQTAKLVASDGKGAGTSTQTGQSAYGDALGSSVAISGDTIVTGAPRAAAGGQDYAGKLYVFTAPSTGWVNSFQTAELAASNATVDDTLGSAVAFDGQTVVGAVPNRNNNHPSEAYVFTKPASGGWVSSSQQAAQIPDPANSSSDGFGRSLALSGSTIAVGAPYTTDGSTADGGAVYTFTDPGTGWTSTLTEAKLVPASPVPDETMGLTVGIDGATLVAGAPHGVGNGGPRPSGAAYVFTQGASWQAATQARLIPSDAHTDDSFGSLVAVSGPTILVAGTPNGAKDLYGFVEPAGGWASAPQTTETSLGSTVASGGGPLAITGSTIVAGLPSANAGATAAAGAALVLSTATTSQTTTSGAKTSTPAPAPPTQFQAPSSPPLTYTSTPVFTDTTTAADIIAGLFGLTPGSGETENLGEFTFVAYCRRPQGQCAAGTSFGQQLGTNTNTHAIIAKAKKKKPKKAKPVIYGSGKISIAAGKHATVTVKLTALGRRLLAKNHVLRGTLRIALGTAGSSSHAYTLRYHAAKKKHHKR